MFLDFLIGGISAGVAKTSLAPIELYRIQQQNYFLPNTTLRQVVKNEGIRVLNDTPKEGADNQLICFLHPKDTLGVLIELCQEK